MADEQTTETAEAEVTTESVEESVEQGTSLFGKPVMTDEEMQADTSEEESESTEETDTSQPEDSEDESDNEVETEEGKEEEKADSDEEEDDQDNDQEGEPEAEVKVPPGFVDLKALHAERAKRQGLQRKVEELTQMLSQGTKPPEQKEGEEEFKELSDDEFSALMEDDAIEAVLYLKRKGDHERQILEQTAKERAEKAEKAKMEMIGDSARGLMQAAIPGFFDADKNINTELVGFAAENGFTEELLPLTVPETMIMAPGDEQPRPLGDLAAHLVIALNNMRVRYNAVDPQTIEKEVAAKVTAELTKKMRTDKSPTTSFMDSPGGSNNDFKTQKILSPAEVARLSDKEQEAYLMGG